MPYIARIQTTNHAYYAICIVGAVQMATQWQCAQLFDVTRASESAPTHHPGRQLTLDRHRRRLQARSRIANKLQRAAHQRAERP